MAQGGGERLNVPQALQDPFFREYGEEIVSIFQYLEAIFKYLAGWGASKNVTLPKSGKSKK